MQFISLQTAGRVLIRFASASVVRIALSATLTTPQPALALENHTPVVSMVQADGNAGGFAGVGPGWG